MEKYKMKCSVCGAKFSFPAKLLGQSRACPSCGVKQPLTAPGVDAAPPPVDALPARESAAATDDGSSPVSVRPAKKSDSTRRERFPERMKANKALAGRICPGCSDEIELGDDVYNCPACQNTMHLQCFEANGSCANPDCRKSKAKAAGKAAAAVVVADAAEDGGEAGADDLKECGFCGEMIKKKARKCRYCGEMLLAKDRRREQERAKREEADEKLTTAEIVFGLLCGGIACIVSIVWMIQGKKKGQKLFLIALVSQVFWGIIRAVGRH